MALCWLFLVLTSRAYSLVGARELLLVVASLVAELGLEGSLDLSSCRAWASLPCGCGTRDLTCVPYIDRWSLNH